MLGSSRWITAAAVVCVAFGGLSVGASAAPQRHQPPKATHLSVKAPAKAKPAATISVVVTARTAKGKIASSYRGKVKFTSTDRTATLPKAYTFTKKDAGRHAFSKVRLRHVGKDAITITDTKHHTIKGKVVVMVSKPAPVCATYTVDAVHGSDSNTGGCKSPFKTITHALSIATSGSTVGVLPGTYNAANGEVSPLEVKSGVTLIGEGTSTPVIQLDKVEAAFGNALISGFTIKSSVYLDAAGDKLTNSTVEDDSICVVVNAGGSATLTHDMIKDCTNGGSGTGVLVSGTSSATIGNTVLTANDINLDVDTTSTADLSGGGDTLTCGTEYDVFTNSVSNLQLTNAKWDHSPPVQGLSTSKGNFDIVKGPASGGVTVTGYSLAASPCT